MLNITRGGFCDEVVYRLIVLTEKVRAGGDGTAEDASSTAVGDASMANSVMREYTVCICPLRWLLVCSSNCGLFLTRWSLAR